MVFEGCRTMTLAIDLPERIIIKILLRLRGVDLLRFKCVSKSWYALFHSQWFIDEHLKFMGSKSLSSHLLVNSWQSAITDGLYMVDIVHNNQIEARRIVFSVVPICIS